MIRFKYSLTLWVEDSALIFFVLPPAIALSVVANEFNPFFGGLYYFINIVGFVFGYIVGLATWITTAKLMRKRTVWIDDWKNKYNNPIFPICFDNSLHEKSFLTESTSEKIDKKERWADFEFKLAFDDTWQQKALYFCVTLMLLLKEYYLLKEYGQQYSLRVFLDSFSFFMAFMYLTKPIFSFFEYVVCMTPRHRKYTTGSFWHKLFLIRLLIINTFIYGVSAYYSHQLFLLAE